MPEKHLELHHRRADHREQPRRQRYQLRRELRVRHTGSDRRQQIPVPCEQHRHEQLEPLLVPLQQSIRSFAHTRSSRQEGRRALPTAAEHSSLRIVRCVYPGSSIPLGYPVSTLQCPQFSAAGVPGRAPTPSCCAHAWWPQCTRTATHRRRLATASSACQPERDSKTAKPGENAHRHRLGAVKARGKRNRGDGRVGGASKPRAEGQPRRKAGARY